MSHHGGFQVFTDSMGQAVVELPGRTPIDCKKVEEAPGILKDTMVVQRMGIRLQQGNGLSGSKSILLNLGHAPDRFFSCPFLNRIFRLGIAAGAEHPKKRCRQEKGKDELKNEDAIFCRFPYRERHEESSSFQTHRERTQGKAERIIPSSIRKNKPGLNPKQRSVACHSCKYYKGFLGSIRSLLYCEGIFSLEKYSIPT